MVDLTYRLVQESSSLNCAELNVAVNELQGYERCQLVGKSHHTHMAYLPEGFDLQNHLHPHPPRIGFNFDVFFLG